MLIIGSWRAELAQRIRNDYHETHVRVYLHTYIVLTDVNVREPDEVGRLWVQEDVVVARLVAEEVLNLDRN